MNNEEYKAVRKQIGNQEEVAQKLGVSLNTVSQRELGEFPITLETELALLRVMEVERRKPMADQPEIELFHVSNDAKPQIDAHYPPDWISADPVIQQMIRDVIPPGNVTRHAGFLKFNIRTKEMDDRIRHSVVLDIVWELIRQASFPGRPSRCISLFASATVEDARRFASTHRPEQAHMTMWRITANRYFRADMNWLSAATPIDMMAKAALYWNGNSTEDPNWEYLVQPEFGFNKFEE